MSDIENVSEESFTPILSPAEGRMIPVEPEEDLISDIDLRNLMVQLSPMHLKDVNAMEMAVENFYVFHDSPEALSHPESLQYLGARDLEWLASKHAIRIFQYITCEGEQKRLSVHRVVFRPSNLKAEVLIRIKRACSRTSAWAIVRHLQFREHVLSRMEASGEISVWIRKRLLGEFAGSPMRKLSESQVKRLPQIFERLAFEHFLDQDIKPLKELKEGIFYLLTRKPEANGFLEESYPPPGDIAEYLRNRMQRPILTQLSDEFHVLTPAIPAPGIAGRSELDYIHDLYCEACRAILIVGMDEDAQRAEYADPMELIHIISAHASFYDEEHWPRGREFLSELKGIIELRALSTRMRREMILGGVAQKLMSSLNNRFDPLLLDAHDLVSSMPDDVRTLFPDTGAAAAALMSILKSNAELAFFTERRGSGPHEQSFVLFKANLPGAFVQNPERRTFFHAVAKENGYPRGIYDFLISVKSSDPKKLVDDQLELSRAIREWEDHTQKVQKPKSVGWIERLTNWILKLLGFGEFGRRKSDKSKNTTDASGAKAKHAPIPARAQKAIDYVERNNRGLIWLDELMPYLHKTYGSEGEVASIILQDAQDRYVELDSLRPIRRLFVSRHNLELPDWRQKTLDYLENRFSPGPDIRALLEYLKSDRTE